MFYKTLFFLAVTTVCSAADWSTLYSTSTVEAEKPRLRTSINYLIEKEIIPFLPSSQALLFGLQNIELPANGFRSDPLDFYAQNGRIILPARTLLFIEDLSRAYGWMWANRYTTKTADEYLSMLRYRSASDFPDGRYPAPREALHVPDNALSDPKVVQASVRLRRSAYAFMLLHQFGHLKLHHESGAHGYSEADEEEADDYALEVMKNNSAPPTGALLIVHSLLFFEGGSPGSLHPVSTQRLEAMAHYLDEHVLEFVRGRTDRMAAMDGIHSIALLLREGSEWLSIRSHQEELEQLAMKTDSSTLEPRPLPATTK